MFPCVVVGVSILKNVAPPGHVDGAFGGRHGEIVVLRVSVACTVVASVKRFRVLEDLF